MISKSSSILYLLCAFLSLAELDSRPRTSLVSFFLFSFRVCYASDEAIKHILRKNESTIFQKLALARRSLSRPIAPAKSSSVFVVINKPDLKSSYPSLTGYSDGSSGKSRESCRCSRRLVFKSSCVTMRRAPRHQDSKNQATSEVKKKAQIEHFTTCRSSSRSRAPVP